MLQSVDGLERWVASASHMWLFLDYDGTLADFAAHPDRLDRDPELVSLISRLAGAVERFRITIISGRPLDSLQELLPVNGIYLAGVYGIETQTPAGNILRRGDYSHIRPSLEAARPAWEKIIAGKTGYFIEDKGWSLTLHAPVAKLKEVEQVFSFARQAAGDGRLENQFRWFEGPNYLEIVPVQAHKGETVKFLFKRYPFSGRQLVYIGDDDKDQEAFEDVHELGGINLQVASPRHPGRYPGSDYLLDSPRAVRAWLNNLL
jgi:trehalose 6-phosphate phosphatase